MQGGGGAASRLLESAVEHNKMQSGILPAVAYRPALLKLKYG